MIKGTKLDNPDPSAEQLVCLVGKAHLNHLQDSAGRLVCLRG